MYNSYTETTTTYTLLSYDPYGSASAFFANPLMKVPYEGRTHLRERGWKKPYGPTTKADGLACSNFKQICLQIGRMIKYLLTKLGRAKWENISLSVMAHGPRCARSVRHDLEPNIFPSGPPT